MGPRPPQATPTASRGRGERRTLRSYEPTRRGTALTLKLPPEADDLLSAWEPYASEATGGHTWGIGGETILAARWKHRISIDLDVFLRESEWVERFADPARPGMESLRRRFQMEGDYRVQARGSRGVKIRTDPRRGGGGRRRGMDRRHRPAEPGRGGGRAGEGTRAKNLPGAGHQHDPRSEAPWAGDTDDGPGRLRFCRCLEAGLQDTRGGDGGARQW